MRDYSRRQFCELIAAGTAGSLLWPDLLAGAETAGAGKRNVLFIAVDDLRPQLGCYGNAMVQSPHIDRLASEGAMFEQAYCQMAICAPSRASVLSGCRPDTTRVWWLNTPLRKAMPDVRSMPEHFRKHGYETISIGKVYHHHNDDLRGWSQPPRHPKGQWEGRGYLSPEATEQVRADAAELAAQGKRSSGRGPASEAADVPDNAYPDGLSADAAIRQLQRFSNASDGKGKPFFLGLGFLKPHLPFNAPKRYWDLYDPAKITLPDNPSPPQGASEYSLTNWGELRAYLDMPDDGPLPDDLARRLIHGYYACVSYVDAQIGRVLAALDQAGLRDNTVVMLWGDHGWKLGEYGAWSKHTNFELDTRAPLIVRAPGTTRPGTRTKALVEFVDMYPSLCDLAGLPQPDHLEGRSFIPLLRDPNRPWKTAAFSQFPRINGVMGYAMRTERYRYVEWRDRTRKKILARELYDHARDPGENCNIVDNPAAAAVANEHAAALARGWQGALPGKQ